MVPIAATMSIIARPAIRGPVPGFVFDAATRGTGKSLCADACCTVATGRSAPRATFPIATFKNKIDVGELEKILGGYGRSSAAVVGFDNVAGSFGGAPLDKVLTTTDTVDLRVLGKTGQVRMAWRAVILASGNNLEIVGDTTRRVLLCRMETPLENPEDRTGFKHHPLLPWVEKHRPRLVVAVLTILRAFILAGRPDDHGIKPLGSFEAWTELIARAIAFAGGADVLGAKLEGDSSAASDGKSLLRAILPGWERLQGALPGLTAKGALDALYPRRDHDGPREPDGYDDMREAVEELCEVVKPGQAPTPHLFGNRLRAFKGRVADGRRLVDIPGEDRQGSKRWRVERVG